MLWYVCVFLFLPCGFAEVARCVIKLFHYVVFTALWCCVLAEEIC